MKYTSKIKSRQFIVEGEKKIFILPGQGDLSDDDAYAVAKSAWGKHLIKSGYLTFGKQIVVKEDTEQRGMTISETISETTEETIPDFDNSDDGGDEE